MVWGFGDYEVVPLLEVGACAVESGRGEVRLVDPMVAFAEIEEVFFDGGGFNRVEEGLGAVGAEGDEGECCLRHGCVLGWLDRGDLVL